MTTTTATRTARRRITLAAFRTEAVRRFGDKPSTWRFRCTRCGETQTAADLPRARRFDVAQACWSCGTTVDETKGDERAALLWLIEFDDGAELVACFPLADALDDAKPADGPQSAAQDLPGTGSPLRADNGSAPVPDAATLPSSPFLTDTRNDNAESEA